MPCLQSANDCGGDKATSERAAGGTPSAAPATPATPPAIELHQERRTGPLPSPLTPNYTYCIIISNVNRRKQKWQELHGTRSLPASSSPKGERREPVEGRRTVTLVFGLAQRT